MNWDPAKHPRVPKGSGDPSGEFTTRTGVVFDDRPAKVARRLSQLAKGSGITFGAREAKWRDDFIIQVTGKSGTPFVGLADWKQAGDAQSLIKAYKPLARKAGLELKLHPAVYSDNIKLTVKRRK